MILKELYDSLGITVSEFEKEIGVANAVIASSIKRDSEISTHVLSKITNRYPQVNKNWLLTGQPPMFIELKKDLTEAGQSSEKDFDNQSLNEEEIMRKSPLELLAMAVYNSSVAHLKDSDNIALALRMLQDEKRTLEGATTKKELEGA